MKKLSAALLALTLSLILVLLPAAALAEPMSLTAITVTDPKIYAGEELAMDLTGLELDLTAGVTADGNKGTVQLQVLGGGETALAGIVEMDNGQFVLTADGLDQKYAISQETLLAMAGADAGAGGSVDVQSLTAVSDAVNALLSGSLFEDLGDVFNSLGEEIQTRLVDEGETSYEMLSGTKTMQHVSIEVPAELMDQYLADLAAALDNNPDFKNLLGVIADMSGESEVAETSLVGLYEQAGVSQRMDMDIYTVEDGSSFAAEVSQYVTTPDVEGEQRIDYTVKFEQDENGDVRIYADFDAYEGDAPATGGYFAMTGDDTSATVEIGFGGYEGGEFKAQSLVKVNAYPTTVNDLPGTAVTVTVDDGYSTSEVDVLVCQEGDDIYFEFAADSEGGHFSGAFTGTADEDGISGKLSFGVSSEYDNISVEADVKVSALTADSADVLSGAAGALDIASMGEEDFTNLTNSGMALLINGMSVLDRNVPGLSGLLSGLIGSVSGGY